MENKKHTLKSRFKQSHFEVGRFRRRLAHNDALLQNSLLGLITGIAPTLVIIAFRSLFEIPLVHWLPGGTAESSESLNSIWYFFSQSLGDF